MAATGENVFRFFDLPREMRDEIYTHLTTTRSFPLDAKRKQTEPAIRLGGSSLLIINFRLVNKLFKTEYEDAVLKSARLTIDLDLDYGTYPSTVRSIFTKVDSAYRLGIRDLEVCFKHFRGRPSYRYSTRHLEDFLPLLMSRLPSLRKLSLVLDTTACRMEHLQEAGTDLRHFIVQPLPTISQAVVAASRPVEVSRSILLNCFASETPLPGLVHDFKDKEIDGYELWEFVHDTDRDSIIYRATQATTEPAWNGFELTTEWSGFGGWAEAENAYVEAVQECGSSDED